MVSDCPGSNRSFCLPILLLLQRADLRALDAHHPAYQRLPTHARARVQMR
jgi:hypothetical protein